MKKNEIYMIGGFTGWRQEFIDKLPNTKFDNPINHNQSSVARLDYSDMNSSTTKPSIAYVQQGKRLGTMSYAELGAARAAGMPIISVDENTEKDLILDRVTSYSFNTKQNTLEFLANNPTLISMHNPIEVIDKTKSKEKYKKVAFLGDYSSNFKNLIDEYAHSGKEYNNDNTLTDLSRFSQDNDLIVVNFENGKKHNKNGLFAMGLAYHTKVPILLLEGNNIPYPPLPGLARRTLVKEDRFEQAKEYLKNLGSQHIQDEALVYYNLMNKFNK